MTPDQALKFTVHVLHLMPWRFDDNKGGCLKQFEEQWKCEVEKLRDE